MSSNNFKLLDLKIALPFKTIRILFLAHIKSRVMLNGTL